MKNRRSLNLGLLRYSELGHLQYNCDQDWKDKLRNAEEPRHD